MRTSNRTAVRFRSERRRSLEPQRFDVGRYRTAPYAGSTSVRRSKGFLDVPIPTVAVPDADDFGSTAPAEPCYRSSCDYDSLLTALYQIITLLSVRS